MAPLSEIEPGTHVGPYVIIDRIGRGGMGEVFLGSDTRLRRRVALKCLSGSIPRDRRLDQILPEARAAAAINHPNVATIYDVIEKDDRAFIVMEYVEGETLAARLARERLPLELVIAIGRQLATALAAAHSRQVVHRDLKPGNIQLTPEGIVKVLDFGIANGVRTLVSVDPSGTTVAAAGISTSGSSQPGTPPYMSPEQLLGRSVDARSDIFSLGVVLYEMATGRRPFPDTDTVGLLKAHTAGVPRADAMDRRTPRALADVIARAMHVEREQRYQNADAVGQALDAAARQVGPQRRDRGERVRVVAARTAIAVLSATVLLWLVGFVATVGFNATFGRDGINARFGAEPFLMHFRWGALAVFPGLVIATLTAAAVLAVRFVISLLDMVGPFARRHDRVRRFARSFADAAALNDPTRLAHALAALGLATVVAIFVVHRDLISAWMSLFSTSPIEQLLPMRESTRERLYYNVELDIAILALTFGLVKVLQFGRRSVSRAGPGAIGMLAALIAVLALLRAWPYRTFSHRDFERVDYNGSRCYITGASADELLLLCPSDPPPRNRAVSRSAPGLQRTGVIENVFRGVPQANPPR